MLKIKKPKVLEFGTWNLKLVMIKNRKGILVTKMIIGWLVLLASGCNSENAPDCLQNAGDTVRYEIAVPDFTQITVFEKVALILKEGAEQKVEIESGEYLIEEVSAEVQEGRLLLRNGNGCNLFRDYELTKVYVTSPNITEIRSSSGLPVKSDGILGYGSLVLISESYVNTESETTDGEFDLELAAQNVSLVVNGITYFKMVGTVENLNITIAAGDSRIEAENLIAQNISLNHRGTNDVLINPQLSLSGVIRGTGDVISINRPPEIIVEELFNGRLIFK